jgi:hypothetical protein
MTEREFREEVQRFFNDGSARETEIVELDLTPDVLDTIRLIAVRLSTVQSLPDTLWADLDTCDLLFSTGRGKLWCRAGDVHCILGGNDLINYLLKDF